MASELDGWSEEDDEVAELRAEVARLRARIEAMADDDVRAMRLQHAEERCAELERRALITGALQAAVHALGTTQGSREEIFAAASDALEVRGFRTAWWELDLDARTATLRDIRIPSGVLETLESAVGVTARGYAAPLDGIDAFVHATETGEPVYIEEAAELTKQILQPAVRWLAKFAVRLARVRRGIVAKIPDPDARRPQLLIVLANSLEDSDRGSVAALTRLMAAAAAQARLVTDLERSLDELRETQGQLLHAEKMKALGQLAGGIAHDFNNLLTAITGSAELIRAGVGGDVTPAEEAEIILETTARAAALVRQLLVFARPSMGSSTVIDLNAALEDMRRLLERMLGESYELVTRAHADACLVRVDPEKFQQILLNFVINARDAMPGRGRIEIRTGFVERVPPDAEPEAAPRRWVTLSVRDEGHGMDPEVVARVFEPFFTTKPVGTGTGLGLAVAFRVVRAAGGWIEVESEPGAGTTFTCLLPVADGEELSTRGKRSTVSRAVAPARILVIEDEPELGRLLQRALGGRGHDVHLAPTLAAARLALETREFDLVLSDVRLPDGSGLSLIDDYERRQLPFILSSGYLDSRSSEREISERGLSFLRKPYRIDDLLDLVAEKLS